MASQDDLLCGLLWQRGQAGRPVLPWILLPAFPADGCHIGQPSVHWDLPSQPGLLVNNGMWLGEHSHQLPQHSGVDLIQPHGPLCLCGVAGRWPFSLGFWRLCSAPLPVLQFRGLSFQMKGLVIKD